MVAPAAAWGLGSGPDDYCQYVDLPGPVRPDGRRVRRGKEGRDGPARGCGSPRRDQRPGSGAHAPAGPHGGLQEAHARRLQAQDGRLQRRRRSGGRGPAQAVEGHRPDHSGRPGDHQVDQSLRLQGAAPDRPVHLPDVRVAEGPLPRAGRLRRPLAALEDRDPRVAARVDEPGEGSPPDRGPGSTSIASTSRTRRSPTTPSRPSPRSST